MQTVFCRLSPTWATQPRQTAARLKPQSYRQILATFMAIAHLCSYPTPPWQCAAHLPSGAARQLHARGAAQCWPVIATAISFTGHSRILITHLLYPTSVCSSALTEKRTRLFRCELFSYEAPTLGTVRNWEFVLEKGQLSTCPLTFATSICCRQRWREVLYLDGALG